MIRPIDGRLPLAPLRSPAFRRYLTGQLPSVACSWAQVVALSWVVVQIDPRSLGWLVALQFLPSLLLGPWFGAVADRCDRRRLVMLAEAGLGLVAFGYAAAAAAGALTLPLIYVLATSWGVINALDTPARRSLVPMLVTPGQATSASALAGTVLVLGMTVGTSLGAVLLAAVGVTTTFAVNATSFLADVALLATIRVGAAPRIRRAPRQIRDGMSYVLRSPPLRAAMLALAIIATFAFTIQVSVPILAREAFDGGPTLIGSFFAAVTTGSLVGTLVFAARGAPALPILTRTALAMAVALLVTGLSPYQPLVLLGLAGVGFTWACLLGAVIAILQTAEPQLMGRVMSLFGVVLLGGTTISGPLAAALTATAGPRAPFTLGALAAALVGAASIGTDRRSPAF
jgi:MFS family permease